MRMRRTLVLFAATLALCAPSLRAQERYKVLLTAGTEVRLRTERAPEERVRGRVLASRGDSLLVETRGAAHGEYRLSELRSLEVRGDKDHARGVWIGTGIGAGLALLGGGIDYSRREITGSELVFATVVDGLLGAALGYIFAPKGWQPLPLPR